MTRIKRLIIAISVMILFASTVSAYVPKEYQTNPFMSDYDVYQVSLQHIGERWADYNLDDLMRWYGRPRCFTCLDASMIKRKEIEEKNSLNPTI